MTTLDLSGTPKTRASKSALIAAFGETGAITYAIKAAGVSKQSHYNWLKSDEVYAQAIADAEEAAFELLEQEARRRAFAGVDEPVFQQGKQVGTVRKYSDTLLIFLMKGARPEKYRDNVNVRSEVVNVDSIDAEIRRLEGELSTVQQAKKVREEQASPAS